MTPNRRECLGLLALSLMLASTATPAQDSRDQLVAALRAGGVVLYLRHGATTWSGYDQLEWPRERQRLLSPAGEAQARAIGDAFKRHQIPASRVIASPFERCKDMATIAFGRVDALAPNLVREGAGGQDPANSLRTLLRAPLPAGQNLVIVAHHDNFREVTGTSLPEAGGAVLRPGGTEPGWRLLGVLTPADWSALASG